jgi:HEAT repeat protein
VKVTCYQALGGVLRGSSHEQAYTLLARAAGENDRSLFLAAVDALAAMRDRRIAPLLSRRYAIVDVPLKRKLLEALGQPDAENTALAVTLLLRALVEPELTLRATAAWSLGKHAGQLGSNAAAAEAALERAARDSAWQVRTNAAAALARLRPTKLRSLLRALAGESTPYVRANAILAMAWSADPEAAATAAARLRTDRSPWVRANAVRVLHALRTPDILLSDARKIPTAAKLVEVIAAEDPDPRVRLVAGHLRHPQRGEEGRWIGLYVLDQEEKPLRNDLFMFVAPGGLARAAWSDGLGEAWEEGVDDGLCFVELSPPAPPSAHHAP